MGCRHSTRVFLPQRPGVCSGRQCRAAKTHLQRRQPRKVQAPCPSAPHSLRRRRPGVSERARARARPRPRLARPRRPLRPLRPAQPVTCSTLRLPVPLVVLAVAAGEVSGAHAEAAQYAGAAVPAAARPRGRTCGGGLGVSSARGPLHLRSPRRAE